MWNNIGRQYIFRNKFPIGFQFLGICRQCRFPPIKSLRIVFVLCLGNRYAGFHGICPGRTLFNVIRFLHPEIGIRELSVLGRIKGYTHIAGRCFQFRIGFVGGAVFFVLSGIGLSRYRIPVRRKRRIPFFKDFAIVFVLRLGNRYAGFHGICPGRTFFDVKDGFLSQIRLCKFALCRRVEGYANVALRRVAGLAGRGSYIPLSSELEGSAFFIIVFSDNFVFFFSDGNDSVPICTFTVDF